MAWNFRSLAKLFRQKKNKTRRPARRSHRLRVEPLEDRRLLAGLMTHSISGNVFLDDNNNSVQDGGEADVVGATVNLFLDNGNGTFDAGDTSAGSTTSGAGGTYSFNGLSDGTYFLEQPAQTVGINQLTQVVSSPIALATVVGVTIDTFDTTLQSVSATNGGTNPDHLSLAATEALGGERDIFAQLSSPSGRIEILVNDATPNVVEFGALSTSTGTRLMSWDGADGDATTIAHTGLGGIDLTSGGQSTAIQYTIGADQTGGMGTVRVFTDANNWSEASLTIPNTGGAASATLVSLFATDFISMGAGGPANFTNVGAIEFEVDGAQAIDVQMDLINAVGPEQAVANIANPVFTPGINIEKATNGQDADATPGPFVPVGNAVTWTYVITNTGNTSLGTVAVTDNQGVTVSFLSGDTDNDSLLDVTETWTFQGSGTAAVGQYTNIGSVDANPVLDNGNDIAGIANVTDTDPSNHFGAQPGIQIEKATNGQDADTGTGPLVAVGGAVTWTYVVTNTGNTQLDTVTVVDDQGVTVSFVSGDTDNDNRLDINETWTFQATGTAAAGQYTNIGTANGNPVDDAGVDIAGLTDVNDTDPSNHFGAQPAVNIEKATNGQDADTATGPLAFVGQSVTFTYTVTNTGNVPLTNVVVVDDNGTTGNAGDDFNPSFTGGDTNNNSQLDLTEIWTYAAMRVVTAGQYTNLSSITAQDSLAQNVNDTDPSNHFGVTVFSKRRLLSSTQ